MGGAQMAPACGEADWTVFGKVGARYQSVDSPTPDTCRS